MSTEDMSDALALLSTGTYSVTRATPDSIVAGVRVPGATSTFTIDAVVLPLQGLEAVRLADGFRNAELKALFTASELRAVDSAMPDIVTVDGQAMQVQSVEKWADTGSYYRAILVRPAS